MPKARKPAATASEVVAKSQQKNFDAGGKRSPNVVFSPEEAALWDRLEAKVGGPARGRAKRTLIAAMQALAGKNDITQEQVVAWIQEHTK